MWPTSKRQSEVIVSGLKAQADPLTKAVWWVLFAGATRLKRLSKVIYPMCMSLLLWRRFDYIPADSARSGYLR